MECISVLTQRKGEKMKRYLGLFSILFATALAFSSCSASVTYMEKVIADSYVWNGYEIVTIDVSYPEFDTKHFPNLSEAIFSEFCNVEDEYNTLCKDRQELCEKDPAFANLKCYITATYDVKSRGDMIYVTLVRDYFGGGAACHGYTKTIEYNTKTDGWREIKSEIH